MAAVQEFIEKTNRAGTQEEVFRHLCAALKRFGYNHIIYTLLTDHPSLKRKAGHGIFTTYPADWLRHYHVQGYASVDPVIRHGFTTSAPYTWESLSAHSLTKKEKRILEEARDAGLLSGAAVALYGPRMEIAGIGMASHLGKVAPGKDALSAIRLIAAQFHQAWLNLERKETVIPQVHLTPREKEILAWSAEGKSIGVIASILAISSNTVNFHFKNVYRKLGVHDRPQAVTRAIITGLIHPARIRA